jgi:hypothetical protein
MLVKVSLSVAVGLFMLMFGVESQRGLVYRTKNSMLFLTKSYPIWIIVLSLSLIFGCEKKVQPSNINGEPSTKETSSRPSPSSSFCQSYIRGENLQLIQMTYTSEGWSVQGVVYSDYANFKKEVVRMYLGFSEGNGLDKGILVTAPKEAHFDELKKGIQIASEVGIRNYLLKLQGEPSLLPFCVSNDDRLFGDGRKFESVSVNVYKNGSIRIRGEELYDELDPDDDPNLVKLKFQLESRKGFDAQNESRTVYTIKMGGGTRFKHLMKLLGVLRAQQVDFVRFGFLQSDFPNIRMKIRSREGEGPIPPAKHPIQRMGDEP